MGVSNGEAEIGSSHWIHWSVIPALWQSPDVSYRDTGNFPVAELVTRLFATDSVHSKMHQLASRLHPFSVENYEHEF